MHSLMRKRETASYLLHGLLTDDVLLEQCPPERQEALLPLAPCTVWDSVRVAFERHYVLQAAKGGEDLVLDLADVRGNSQNWGLACN